VVDPIGLSEDDAVTVPFDHDRAAAAVRELLLAIGENPDREGLRDTPERVARMYSETLSGLRLRAEDVLTTTFDIGHDEMVLVKDIEVYSLCEHHLVPFHGVAHVGYIPDSRSWPASSMSTPNGPRFKNVSRRRLPTRCLRSSSHSASSWCLSASTFACR